MKTETQDEYSSHIQKQDKAIQALTLENEQLKADIKETTSEAQIHIDDVEKQNSLLKKEIDALRTKADLSKAETATGKLETKSTATKTKNDRSNLNVILGKL